MNPYPTGDPVEHAGWCRQMFASLAEGGVWGIPRSGVVFRKEGDALVLTESMPYDESMPLTFAQFTEQQNGEFETVREHFAAAGIEVRR
jgi:hypothetical protein